MDLPVAPEVSPREKTVPTSNGLPGEASGEAQEGFDGPRPPGEGGSPRALLEVLEAAQATKGGALTAQTGPALAIACESALPPASYEVP